MGDSTVRVYSTVRGDFTVKGDSTVRGDPAVTDVTKYNNKYHIRFA